MGFICCFLQVKQNKVLSIQFFVACNFPVETLLYDDVPCSFDYLPTGFTWPVSHSLQCQICPLSAAVVCILMAFPALAHTLFSHIVAVCIVLVAVI